MKRKPACPFIQWSRIMRIEKIRIPQCWLLSYGLYNLKIQLTSFCCNTTKPVYNNNNNNNEC